MVAKAFCETGYRLHVVGLVLFAAAVMAWAVTVPAARPGFTQVRPAPAPVVASPPVAGSPSGSRPASTPEAMPVARTFTGPAAAAGVDVVGGATPAGGLRFVGEIRNGSFRLAAQRIRPSVVSVTARGEQGLQRQGSGVIVEPSGYVITSYHVVAGVTSLAVKPSDAVRPYEASVVAADPVNDLAVIRFTADRPFTAAALADSSRVQIGDWVLAVGHPFGLGLTFTSGIVGAKRSVLTIQGGTQHRGLLQTDAPINEGSSGGPLVNLRGEVVGINTAIFAPTGVFSGAGFAVPSNRVGAFVARTIPTQVSPVALVQPAQAAPATTQQAAPSGAPVWLGVGLVEMTPTLATELSFPAGRGLYVDSVVLDSPADEAEILRGDVLTAVGGQPVSDVASLARTLAPLAPGVALAVEIWRGGKTEQLSLRTRPGAPAGAR